MKQLAFPGLAPSPKTRPLHVLWWEACCDHWAPALERIASERELGPEGIGEGDLVGEADFLDMEQFRAWCDANHVLYR